MDPTIANSIKQTKSKKKFGRFTSAQKEILCNLDLSENAAALQWQKKKAAKLARQIELDVKHTLYNPDKINKYRKQAGLPIYEEESCVDSYAKTETVHTLLGWFTSIRIFCTRLNNFLKLYNLGFLKDFFDILGLSYIFEFVADVADIVISTFFVPLRNIENNFIAEEKASKAQIYWWRFKNKITQEEDLIPRMINAAVWFSINLTTFILTGGVDKLFLSLGKTIAIAPAITKLTRLINVGGYIFDVFNETYRGIKDFFTHSNTLIEVKKQIIHLTEKKQLHIENNEKYQAIENKIQQLQFVEKKLDEKINYSVIPKRIYNWALFGVISIGMGLALFPPAVEAGTKLCQKIGRGLTLSCCIVGGLGRRIYYKACEWGASLKKLIASPGSPSSITPDKKQLNTSKSFTPTHAFLNKSIPINCSSKAIVIEKKNNISQQLACSAPQIIRCDDTYQTIADQARDYRTNIFSV